MLAKSNNPSDILGSIRADLVKAEKQRQKLPLLKFAAYRKDVEALPPSTTDYWTTVAAIINYQSFLNQLENKAPDPSTVARPCLFVTAGGISNNNTLEGTSRFSRCIVDLDTTTNFVDSAVIRDSVVRYHGGAVTIRHAIFIHCAFILDLKDFPQKPARPDLLRDLLASDQIYFTLPSAG